METTQEAVFEQALARAAYKGFATKLRLTLSQRLTKMIAERKAMDEKRQQVRMTDRELFFHDSQMASIGGRIVELHSLLELFGSNTEAF